MKNSSWHRIFSAFAKICKVFFPSSSTQPCSSFPKSQQATLSLAKKETSSMNQVLEASRMVVHPTTVLWNRSGISVRLQRLQLSQWHLLRGSREQSLLPKSGLRKMWQKPGCQLESKNLTECLISYLYVNMKCIRVLNFTFLIGEGLPPRLSHLLFLSTCPLFYFCFFTASLSSCLILSPMILIPP